MARRSDERDECASVRRRREGLLVLADGTTFEGEMIGAASGGAIATGEVVFNTVLSGYQEVITDPSYAGQIITFTYPHIGNYGVTDFDDESARPFCRGVIVRDLARRRSNWRSTEDLDGFLQRHGVAGIAGIDTRRLTRHLRDFGAIPGAFGFVGDGGVSETALKAAALAEPGTDGVDLVAEVTCPRPYSVGSGPRRVVAYDYGMKRSILRQLGEFATVDVVPAWLPASEIIAHRPDGVFLSNGPGDPAMVEHADRQHPRDHRCRHPAVRYLPRSSTAVSRARRRHVQAAVRSPRRQSPRAQSRHRAHRDHEPEPQLLRRYRIRWRAWPS